MCERAQTPVTAFGQTGKMSDAWLRRLVMLATVLLVLHAVGSWAYAALGVPAAIVSAGLVGAVSSQRPHGGPRGRQQRLVRRPDDGVHRIASGREALRFTRTNEQGWWARSIEFAPFLIGFAAPVLLLLTAYTELGRRAPPQRGKCHRKHGGGSNTRIVPGCHEFLAGNRSELIERWKGLRPELPAPINELLTIAAP